MPEDRAGCAFGRRGLPMSGNPARASAVPAKTLIPAATRPLVAVTVILPHALAGGVEGDGWTSSPAVHNAESSVSRSVTASPRVY